MSQYECLDTGIQIHEGEGEEDQVFDTLVDIACDPKRDLHITKVLGKDPFFLWGHQQERSYGLCLQGPNIVGPDLPIRSPHRSDGASRAFLGPANKRDVRDVPGNPVWCDSFCEKYLEVEITLSLFILRLL